MSQPLLSPSAARQRFLRLLGTAAGFALALAAPAAAQAQTVYGLGYASAATLFPIGTQVIGTLDVATGTISSFASVSGVTAGQILVGMDSRPATGELFALGYDASLPGNNSRLYTLAPGSGVATPVGNAFRLELGGATDRIGFDFNPTVDRIRVVGSYNPTSGNTNNYRLNPTPNGAGAIAIINDGVLAYAAGTPADPNIGTAAYTNSAFGAATTVLYDVDETNGLLTQQDAPNAGTLATQVPITFNGAGFDTPRAIDVDIYTNPSTGAQSAYLIEVTAGGSSNFYNLNLATGAATSVGAANVVFAGSGVEVRDIAAAIAPRSVPALQGQLAYAVTTNNNLISFDTQNPSVIRTLVAITGLPAAQTLVGTDFRPNTGQLFGLGYSPTAGNNARLYTINLTTGAATAVGTTDIPLDLGTDLSAIGFDFNPTVDRIRVVGASDKNYRLNPNNGAVAFTDGDLAYAAGDPNAGQNPTVGSGAYTNSFVGSTATGLYVLDHVRGTISLQNPPNAGGLTNSRSLTGVNGVNVGGAIGAANDLDVYFNGTSDTPYLAAVPNGQVNSRFYSLSAFSPTATGAQTATDLGPIGGATTVRDISVLLAPNSTPTTAADLTGQLLYAVAGGNLISFDSGNPGVIRTAVNITGLPTDGSQVIAGADFRPLTGQLFALGYNAATSQGQIYTLNLATGALTTVGGLNAMTLGAASGIGFDFNPVADRIRIVGANGNNYRLNPADGVLATVSDGPTGRVLSGTAYTNNDNNANTGTTQYGYDQTTNEVVLFSNPNAGTNSTLGSSGITVNTANGVDFDIYSNLSNAASPVNTAFAVAAPGTTTADVLYNVSLANGAFTSLGQIGNGSNLSGLAAFLTPGPVIAAGLTWTGAVSTDWGTAGNWSPAQVPTAADNVTIPNVANDPVVTGNQLANALTLSTGAVLTLADASVLSVSGNITNNSATIAASGASVTGRVTLAGTTVQTISGTQTNFPNLTVGTAGVAAGAPVAIRRGLVLNGNYTTNSQVLTLLSDATGTAYVVNNGAAVVAGQTTVQRYISPDLNPNLGYRHFSSPISAGTVASLATSAFTPVVNPAYNTSATPTSERPFPTVYGYDQSRLATTTNNLATFDKGWFSPNALSDALNVGQGYSVNLPGNQTITQTGTLNNGTVTLNVSRNAGPTAAASGLALVGNPYPSPLDWSGVTAAFRPGLDGVIYTFASNDPANPYAGTYTFYNNGIGNMLPVVAMGQGFFVRVTQGQTSASITLQNSFRPTAYTNPTYRRTAAETRPLVHLKLKGAGNALNDDAFVYFEKGASEGFDSQYDGVKLPNTNGLNLSTSVSGQQFSVDGRPELSAAQRVVSLAVGVPAAGSYTLASAELLNLDATPVYLRDLQLGTVTDLRTTPSYQFTVANASALITNRFELVFSPQQALATAPAALAQQVALYPNPAKKAAFVELTASLGRQAVTASLVDALGRQVRTVSLPAQGALAHQLDLSGLTTGVYALRLSTSAGVVVKKLVIE